MPIPDLFSITLPLLEYIQDGKEYSSQDVISILEKQFQLNEEEKGRMLPSGIQRVFVNRIAWAKAELKMGGLIEASRRGFFKITQRGLETLKNKPKRIDRKFMIQFPEYKQKVSGTKKDVQVIEEESNEFINQQTPGELLEIGYQQIRNELVSELLERIKANKPEFFEHLVVDLLLKMGYGGSKTEYAEVVGKVGDGGIDGIIKEDRLGLDVIYVQAKRWEGPVGAPEIHKFAGALLGKRATKGIFITTSKFTKDAIEFTSTINNKIVLISGQELADLMIDYGVGVSIKQTYEIKKIDSDYFDEE